MLTTQRLTVRAAGLAATATLLIAGITACGTDDSAEEPTETAGAIAEAPEGTFPGKKATGDPVKVGLMNPEGGTAVNMPESRVAAETAVAYANAELGGLGGREIELVTCKTKEEDPASLTGCANQMVQDEVVGLVEGNTGNGALIVPIITGAGIAYTSYQGASAAEIGTPSSFLWTGGVPGVSIAMAKASAGEGVKKFTLFVTGNGTVVESVTALATPIFAGAGIDLTITAIPVGTPDTSPQVAAGLKSDPGAVGIIGDATMCTSTLKGLETVGSKVPRYVIQPCMDPSVYQAVPAGLDASELFTSSGGSGDDEESKAYRAVMAKYAPGETTSGAAQSGYQAMLGFIRMVNAGIGSNEVTAASVIEAIKSAKDVPVPVGGGMTMTCDGTKLPKMPGFCSASSLRADIENGTVTSYEIVE